jgi:hypothetical protein
LHCVDATLASQIFARQIKIPSGDRNLSYIPIDGMFSVNRTLAISSGDPREIPEGYGR